MTPNYHKITFGTNVPNVVRQLLQQRCVTCCGLSGGTVCYNYHDYFNDQQVVRLFKDVASTVHVK
jgi:hypothetical protein